MQAERAREIEIMTREYQPSLLHRVLTLVSYQIHIFANSSLLSLFVVQKMLQRIRLALIQDGVTGYKDMWCMITAEHFGQLPSKMELPGTKTLFIETSLSDKSISASCFRHLPPQQTDARIIWKRYAGCAHNQEAQLKLPPHRHNAEHN